MCRLFGKSDPNTVLLGRFGIVEREIADESKDGNYGELDIWVDDQLREQRRIAIVYVPVIFRNAVVAVRHFDGLVDGPHFRKLLFEYPLLAFVRPSRIYVYVAWFILAITGDQNSGHRIVLVDDLLGNKQHVTAQVVIQRILDRPRKQLHLLPFPRLKLLHQHVRVIDRSDADKDGNDQYDPFQGRIVLIKAGTSHGRFGHRLENS